MDKQFEALNCDDVVSVNSDTFEDLDITRTTKVIHLLEAIQECFGADTEVAALFNKEGVECEVLKLGASEWEQGKIRIRLEFCPQPYEPSMLQNDLHYNYKEATN